jgi:hypothetical protein
MSLNNIQLPASLHASMFKNSLVDLKSKSDGQILQEENKLEFLGGNEKKIIFLTNDDQNKFISDSAIIFLNALLNACFLTLADIALINFNQYKMIRYSELTDGLNARKVLIFGISADKLGLPFTIPFFQVQKFQEAVFLFCPSFEEVQKDKGLKKQLWNCLQKIFNVKK